MRNNPNRVASTIRHIPLTIMVINVVQLHRLITCIDLCGFLLVTGFFTCTFIVKI